MDMNQENGIQAQSGTTSTAQADNSGGYSPAADPFATGGPNPFNAPVNGDLSNPNANSTMPNGMPQSPPATDPNYQQFLQWQKTQQPAQGANPPANGEQQSASPLDQFLPPGDNGTQGNGQQQPPAAPAPAAPPAPVKSIFDNTRDNYAKLVENTNFAGEITPEVMQSILGGDVQALVGVINTAARGAFAAASFSSAQVTKSGMATQFDQFQSDKLPTLLQDHSFQQGWANKGDAILNHPAVQPLVEQQTAMFRSQFPQAGVNEIQTKVVDYFKTVAAAFNTTDNGQQGSGTPANAQEGEQKTGLEQLFNFG